MLLPKHTGLLPPTRALNRVRARSLSGCASRTCTSSAGGRAEDRQTHERRRRFTTVSVHASAPARPCPSDVSPCNGGRPSSSPTNASSPFVYSAPTRSTHTRQKGTPHSADCTWSNKTGPRDQSCPGCAKEVQDAPHDTPYEFSSREALWRHRMEHIKRLVRRDPYNALFGYSERLLSGKGMPLGWWSLEDRAKPKVAHGDKSDLVDGESRATKRQRKDSGVEILEASYKWSSSGYDSRTGQSWQKQQEFVYDPVEGKMMPAKKDKSAAQVPSPTAAPADAPKAKAKAYDDFENLQHQKEADSHLEQGLKGFDIASATPQRPLRQDSATKSDRTKTAMEQSWAAEKQHRNSGRTAVGESSADKATGSPILDTQQREWERELVNVEHASSVRQTERDGRRNPQPTQRNWTDYKAGKEVRRFGKSGPLLQTFRTEHGVNLGCLSILRKDKPLKHMTPAEFGQHRAAIRQAFAMRAERCEESDEATPADGKLKDEVEGQKRAMEAWESKSRKRQSATATSEQSLDVSYTSGEGDLDARVADYCTDAAGWYKRPTQPVQKTPTQDELAAAALVDAMRHIYETAYGTINTSHRQPAAVLESSLDHFDAQPAPETVDTALREFERSPPKVELDSSLREYEQREGASGVDDALRIYEREPREGLDGALSQFEKHTPPSQSYGSPAPLPAEGETADLGSTSVANEAAAATVDTPISSWRPRVEPRLQPALDRMSVGGTSQPAEAVKALHPEEAIKEAESEPIQDEFSYPGESEKFAYDGALESCREHRPAEVEKTLQPSAAPLEARYARVKRETKSQQSSSPWGVNPARRARKADRPAVNPIDKTTALLDAELMTQTGNFASPTGFVNHDMPIEHDYTPRSKSSPAQRGASRKVRRTEEVFSGTHGLQRESIPQIVEHFRKLGLGPELEAYARSSTLLDPKSADASPGASSTGTPPGGNGSEQKAGGDNHGRRRGAGVGRTILLTVPSVLAAVYATGVVVEYFREEEARASASGPPRPATHEGQDRGWHSVRVGPAIRRRREAAAAAAKARQDEDEAAARLAWERERYYDERDRRDEQLQHMGRVVGALGAAAAALVLLVGWSGGQ